MNKEVIFSKEAPVAYGPYSQAVRTGNLVFFSGQIAPNKATQPNVAEEVEEVMKNVVLVLKAANLTTDNIVKTTIFLKNMDDFSVVNEVYGTFFTAEKGYPARETVEVARLPKDVRVEISCIATI